MSSFDVGPIGLLVHVQPPPSLEQSEQEAAMALEKRRREAFEEWFRRDKESIRAKTKVGMSTEYALWDAFVAGWDAAQAADVWE